MYEDKSKSIDWLKIILRVVICILVFLLILKGIALIVDTKKEKEKTNNISNNLSAIQEKLSKYFDESNTPSEIGSKQKYSLEELYNENIIDKVVDSNNKECNYDKSYAEVTRLDKEYQVKVYLVCGDSKDYSNNFITIDSKKNKKEETKKETTTKKEETTVKTTTKKVTTTKVITTTKKIENNYEVSFNPNGGNLINSQILNKGEKIKEVKPVREGYTFVGWYYHGEKYDMNTPVNSNIVLVAKWIKNAN